MTDKDLLDKYKKFSDLREAGKVKEAIEGYRNLMQAARKKLFVQVPEMLGVAFRMLGKPESGLSFAKQAVRWAIKKKDREAQANARCGLGKVYGDLGRRREAGVEYSKSLQLMWPEVAGKMSGLAGTLAAMAEEAAKDKKYKRADKLIEAAVAMTYPQVMIDDREAGQHYWFMIYKAELYKKLGRKKEARELAREALAGFKKLNQYQKVRIERAEKLLES